MWCSFSQCHWFCDIWKVGKDMKGMTNSLRLIGHEVLSVSVHVTWFAGIPNACAGGCTRVIDEGQHVHFACMISVYNLSARMEHYALLGLASSSHADKMQQISSIWMAFAPSSSMLMFSLAAEFMVLWRWQNSKMRITSYACQNFC